MKRPGTHGNDPRREPLDAAERELAERLARLGPHGEPPVALDTRILAAAHAATNATPRRARRLPLVVGVAASLVLALGLAWQLQPLLDPPPPPESGSMDMATRRAVEPAPKAAVGSPSEAGPSQAGAGEDGAAEEQRDARLAAPDRVQAQAEPSAAEPPASPSPGARRRAQVEAGPEAFPSAPLPPPPAPPPPAPPPAAPAPPATAPAASAPTAEAEAADRHERTVESRRRLDHVRDAATQAMQESAAAADGAGAQEAEAYLRQAQLDHIRDLRDAGQTAQARDELEAFLARWPGYPLPDDLQALRR